jgi:hypothetical protein
MKMLKRILVALVMLGPLITKAAMITSVFTPLGGVKWSMELGVLNDNSGIPVAEFTVYLPATNFVHLEVTGGPSTWDTIVIQPDPGVPAPGFVDGLVLNVADALALGNAIGGFTVTFELLGATTPYALPFDLYDVDFNLLESGTTIARIVNPGTTLPEPSTGWLVLLALIGTLIGSNQRSGCGKLRRCSAQ